MVFRVLVLCTVHRPRDDPRCGVGVSGAMLETAVCRKCNVADVGRSYRLVYLELFVWHIVMEWKLRVPSGWVVGSS